MYGYKLPHSPLTRVVKINRWSDRDRNVEYERQNGFRRAMLRHSLATGHAARVPQGYAHVDSIDMLCPRPDIPGSVRHAAKRAIRAWPCAGIVSERIPPFPRWVQQLLARRFCAATAETGLPEPASDDCLVRPYLGSRGGAAGRGWSLEHRNFELHLNQLEELGVDPLPVADAMAHALAVMH